MTDLGFIAFVSKLQRDKPNDLIQFFDRKGVYFVYGDDAEFVAKIYMKTTATIKYIGSETNSLASQAIQQGQLENILQDLLFSRLFKFEIYAQKAGTVAQWERVKRGSPGNVRDYEELVNRTADVDEGGGLSGVTVAVDIVIRDAVRIVGVATADDTLQQLQICEFNDDDHLSTLESVLVRIPGARECIAAFDEKDKVSIALQDVIQRCEMVLTKVKKTDFKSSDVDTDLKRLLKGPMALAVDDMPHSMRATSALIKYLELLADDSRSGKWSLKQLEMAGFMRLDAAAVQALSLFPSIKASQKTASLYGLLNTCMSPMGSRRLAQWIKLPLLDLQQIQERQDLIELFYNDTELRESIRTEVLKRTPDLDKLADKFRSKRAKLPDCLVLFDFAERLPLLFDKLSQYAGPSVEVLSERYVQPLEKQIESFAPFRQMVRECVDFEALERHEYLIKACFDGDLTALAQEKEERTVELDRIRQKTERVLSGIKSFKLEFSSQYGYCFKVSRKDEQTLRKTSLKYTTCCTKKEGVQFQTPELSQVSNELLRINEEYQVLQGNIVKEVLDVAAEYMPAVSDVNIIVTDIDLFSSLAHVFVKSTHSFVRPEVTHQGGDLILEGARHPCVELQLDGTGYIPNDVHFLRDKSMFHIITGPNMGGKSTFIRSVGVVVLLAQMGCFVPCKSARISIVDCIMARVGAGDSQSRGVSTFMAEMLETTAILRAATPNSLVIVDELGRGTSTYDGFGLAWAISEYISTRIRCFCFFATHFHELTALADEIPSVANYHVDAIARDNELTMLYKVSSGPSSQSLGIHIAEMANFPETVVNLAKRKARELEDYEERPGDAKVQKALKEQGDGEMMMKKFVDSFKSLPLGKLSTQQLLAELEKLKKTVDLSNPFIAQVLSLQE